MYAREIRIGKIFYQSHRARKLKQSTFIALAVFLFVIFVPPIFADNLPVGDNTGAQAERFRKAVEKEKKKLQKKKAASVKIEFPPKEKEALSPGPTFELKEISIIGGTVIKQETIRSIYEPYLNRTVSFEELNRIAAQIEQLYDGKGYLTTKVHVPRQQIVDGKVEIQVAEGKMGRLRIDGNKRVSSKFIERYFHTQINEVLNVKKLQRDVLRLNRNQDLDVRVLIAKGEEEQTSDITLKIEDAFPWHGGVGFDNQGTRLTGKYRSTVHAYSSNVSGCGDSLYISSIQTSLSNGQAFSYTLPVRTYGTKFSMDIIDFNMKVGKEFKAFDITGNTQIYTPKMTWELVLNDAYSLDASAGLDIKSITKKTSGERTSDDQLRILFFGFSMTKNDAYGRTTWVPRFSFSTENFLGASEEGHPSASRAGTGGFFFSYEQELNRLVRMPWDSYLSIRSQIQTASNTLPSSEQFQLGGANSIRGYPEGDYLCDTGGSLSVDWVMPLYLIPESWRLVGSDTSLRHQIEPVVFVDVGGGDLKKILPGESNHKFLAGAGLGLKLHFNNFVYLRMDWAAPIGDGPTPGSGPSNFYVTFQVHM